MPGWGWVLIAVGVIVVIALVVWQAMNARRTRTLQGRFGPEYDRTLERADDRREAEADLAARAKRRDELDIRPLPTASRDRYLEEWQRVQARFVDDPRGAVQEADTLIQSVMRERGYPVDDFEQRAADISVDHPQVVENYRNGHRLASGDTEEQRQAMVHYRALFDELVEETADRPLSRDELRDVEKTRDEEVAR
jgi:FtsZ-interacting cell division protein ZipA